MRLEDLIRPYRYLLDRIAAGRLAWQSPEELAALAGLDPAYVVELLVDLEGDGWVATWEHEDGIDVTLTPISAKLMGVHLAEFGPDQIPRWVRNGEEDPPPPRARRPCQKYLALALLPDPHLGPVELAIIHEECELPPADVAALVAMLDAPVIAREEAARDRRRRRDKARRAVKRAEKARARRKERRARLVMGRRSA